MKSNTVVSWGLLILSGALWYPVVPSFAVHASLGPTKTVEVAQYHLLGGERNKPAFLP